MTISKSTPAQSASIRARTRALRLYDHLEYNIPRLKLALVSEHKTERPWPKIKSALDAAKLLKPLQFAPEEHFVSLHLNAKFEVIGLHEVSHGTLSASLVHPREVFKAALVANSYAILVCHNHPSGSPLTPSKEDFVTVLDHVILGLRSLRQATSGLASEVFSFREVHPELWLK
jgi:DNA repair protein RadC